MEDCNQILLRWSRGSGVTTFCGKKKKTILSSVKNTWDED